MSNMQPKTQLLVVPQDVPVYRILDEKGYFGPDDCLYPEGSLVELHDDPNENMEPMNEMARKRLTTYLTKLDEAYRQVCEKNGRAFIARPSSVEEALAYATEDARKVQMIDGGKGTPIMRGQKRGKMRVRAVTAEDVPQMGGGLKLKPRSSAETAA